MYFKVHNYLPNDAPLGSSVGRVTLYKGDGVAGEWTVPASTGTDTWYDVFTIDAAEGSEKIYPGRMEPPPALAASETGSADWRTSFDWSMWNLAPTGTLLYGVKASTMNNLQMIEAGLYYQVQSPGTFECTDVSFDLSNEGLGQCSEGSFLQGLYRDGNKYDQETGVFQITRGRCCRPKALPAKWGECHEVSTGSPAWGTCDQTVDGKNTALVGLHRNNEQMAPPAQSGGGYRRRRRTGSHAPLSFIDKFKCCAFALTPSP